MVSNMKLLNLLCGGVGTKIIFCPVGFCAIINRLLLSVIITVASKEKSFPSRNVEYLY